MEFFKFECKYCGKKYKQEHHFLNHTCKEKDRHAEMQTPIGRLAFSLYGRWIKKKHGGTTKVSSFKTSHYYRTFMKTAKLLVEYDLPEWKLFVDFMTRKGYTPPVWSNNNSYVEFLTHMDKDVSPSKLIRISAKTIMDECDDREIETSEFFEKVPVNAIISMMERRRISPWLLIPSEKFQSFYNGKNLNLEQREILKVFLNPNIWSNKFNRSPKSKATAQLIVEELSL